MSEVTTFLDLFAGAGGVASLLGFGALLLLTVVLLCPSREPHRRLLALVSAWRRPRR